MGAFRLVSAARRFASRIFSGRDTKSDEKPPVIPSLPTDDDVCSTIQLSLTSSMVSGDEDDEDEEEEEDEDDDEWTDSKQNEFDYEEDTREPLRYSLHASFLELSKYAFDGRPWHKLAALEQAALVWQWEQYAISSTRDMDTLYKLLSVVPNFPEDRALYKYADTEGEQDEQEDESGPYTASSDSHGSGSSTSLDSLPYQDTPMDDSDTDMLYEPAAAVAAVKHQLEPQDWGMESLREAQHQDEPVIFRQHAARSYSHNDGTFMVY